MDQTEQVAYFMKFFMWRKVLIEWAFYDKGGLYRQAKLSMINQAFHKQSCRPNYLFIHIVFDWVVVSCQISSTWGQWKKWAVSIWGMHCVSWSRKSKSNGSWRDFYLNICHRRTGNLHHSCYQVPHSVKSFSNSKLNIKQANMQDY